MQHPYWHPVAGVVPNARQIYDCMDHHAGFLDNASDILDAEKRLIPEMTVAEVKAGIEAGWISGGMIPKVETCIYAIERGVKGAVILDGRVPHAVLRELFTDGGAGTLIRA